MSNEADRIEKRVEELKRELGYEQDKLAIQINSDAADERVIALRVPRLPIHIPSFSG
jgi:hypothetical protein